LSFETGEHIAGFLRLSLPNSDEDVLLEEIAGQAMIREVHVYGPAVPIGQSPRGEAQHIGLGAQLILEAKQLAEAAGYKRIAVISAIGTREYYARHGFESTGLYMSAGLPS
jgi:elongator complex protein 3